MSGVFQPDQVVNGRYRVLRKLGGGGMADVYLCEDLTLGRRVALKVLLQRLLDDPTFIERFRREAQAAAGLNHANVVSIYDWGEIDHTYYIVMEYVEGETLKDHIRRYGRLDGGEAVRIVTQLLAGVQLAHRSGIVHRDIKPQNVMIDPDGNVKVMDFGIARAGESGMTQVGSILGTAQYLAPEQAQGRPVDARSDLYSVGIVLYEMLTGAVPFQGDTAVTVALKHVNEMASEPARLVPGIPQELNQIVLKAIAKDPAQRYQSAEQFARDLRASQVGGPLAAAAYDPATEATVLMKQPADGRTAVMPPPHRHEASPHRAEAPPARPRRRRRLPVILLILALLAVIAAAGFGISRLMGGEAVVPGVVGQKRAAAVAKLKDAGFEANVRWEYSTTADKGTVIRQAPAAGTRMREGETVDLWVSKGTQDVELVSFKGWTPERVKRWLADNDLFGVEKTGRSSAVAEGEVYNQNPAAGSKVERGGTVTYWVSAGDPQVVVPNVTNLTQDAAKTALTDAGLELGSVTSKQSDTVPAGTVISQNPAAGSKVAKGSAVAIVVSSGAPTPTPTPTPTTPTPEPSESGVAVPNVYGMDASTASDALGELGLVSVLRRRSGTGQSAGTVIDVLPDAGTAVAVGSRVTLVVAR